MTIVYRSVKGSPLTNAEVDGNFLTLATDKADKASPTFTGTVTIQQVSELMNGKTGATGVVAHDFSTGAIFYHTSIASDFTANFTSVPTTNDRAIALTLVLFQGGTPYIPSAVQIAGGGQTINWANGITPTGTSTGIDVVTFTLTRISSVWTVLGQLLPYSP
jgi:hypothetical protein